MFLKQSTARTILIGPFIDDTDGKTAETGLASSLGSLDIDLYKGAATSVTTSITATTSDGGVNDITHIANGYYSLELTAANLDTCGELKITVNIAGSLPVWHNFQVLEEAIYDALFAASATGELLVDVAKISGDSTAADNLEAAYDGTGYAGGTTKLDVNVVQVSGDSTAADNLEAAYDGTGYGIQAASAATSVAVSSVTAAGLTDIWTNDGTGLTESYAADGAAPTPSQFLFMIWSCMHDFSISSTTITSKQLNDSTAMTWTINDATTPTSRTRAT